MIAVRQKVLSKNVQYIQNMLLYKMLQIAIESENDKKMFEMVIDILCLFVV